MSALPPKADIGTQSWNVRFVPKADIRRLFDHLVGEQQYRGWHFEAKLLRDLEIDGQQELGWAQDREVFGFGAREYIPGVDTHLTIGFCKPRPVRDECVGSVGV